MSLIEIDWKPDRKRLRSFALCWLVGFGLIGLLVAWRAGAFGSAFGWHGPWIVPVCLWSLALAGGLVGLALPEALRPVYVVWMAVALPIGLVVSHILLGLLYFGLFTPMAIAFRLIGRDALNRKSDPLAGSYWLAHEEPADVKRYFRQF